MMMPSVSSPCHHPQALSLASDDAMADVWYNVGQVAIGIGDLGLSYQARRRLAPPPCPSLTRHRHS